MVTTLYDSFLFFIGGNGDVENIKKDNQTISFEYRKRKYIYIYDENDSLYFRIVQFPIYSHSKDLDVEKIGELLDCVGDYKLVKLFKLGDKLFLSIELLLDANQLTSNQIYGRVLNTLAEVSKHVEEILESHGK